MTHRHGGWVVDEVHPISLAGRHPCIVVAVFEAIRAGASGFVLKDTPPANLLEAVRIVHRGDALLAPSVTRTLVQRFAAQPSAGARDDRRLERLTTREREVMALAAQGLTNRQIADQLVITEATVRTHVSRAMTKLHAHDRAQLVVLAYQTGLVTVDR